MADDSYPQNYWLHDLRVYFVLNELTHLDRTQGFHQIGA